ncbi:hypothetical protein UT300003_32090 [Clostridium sardiniense]
MILIENFVVTNAVKIIIITKIKQRKYVKRVRNLLLELQTLIFVVINAVRRISKKSSSSVLYVIKNLKVVGIKNIVVRVAIELPMIIPKDSKRLSVWFVAPYTGEKRKVMYLLAVRNVALKCLPLFQIRYY